MNKRIGFSCGGVIFGLLFFAGYAKAQIPDKGGSLCATLSALDIQPFVGKSVGEFREDQIAVQCRWKAAKDERSVAINVTKNTQNAQSLWNSNKIALGGNSLKEEPGIGDHAFSVIMAKKNFFPSPGVYFYIIQKNGHLLIVSLSSIGMGTEQMREAFRPIAKKAETAAL